jgi:RNA polymerase sigma-70 factor (ECF subfamily)
MTDRTHQHGGRSCREMFARLSEYMDGELPEDICDRIDTHMEDCPPCRGFLESLRRTVRFIRSSGAEELPEDLKRELLSAAARLRDL